VSNWTYVAIAYTVVWGSLAVYALLLARRVSQAQDIARRLNTPDSQEKEQDGAACDAPPAP
jgi:CcmD family protein